MHVTTRLNVGGLSAQVLAYCAGLARSGHEVVLATGRIGPDEANALDIIGEPPCPIHVINEIGRGVKSADAAAFFKLRRIVRAVRPDIIHTHAAKAGALGRIVAVAARVPVRVHSFHGHVFHGYFSPLVSRAVVGVERALGRLTSAVLVSGESQRRELSERFHIVPAAKIYVTPYGVGLAAVASEPERIAAKRHFGLRARYVIGSVARMVPIKNLALLVDAFARIRNSANAPEAELLLVGDGECRQALQQQAAERGLADQVVLTGWESDLAQVYAALDVLAISSLNEGMPVAALEAMAAGVHVVSTAVGGVVDLIRDGETGWLVPSEDVDALSSALGRALVDPRGAEMTARARAMVGARHSFENACAELSRVYEMLLAGISRHRPMVGGVPARSGQ